MKKISELTALSGTPADSDTLVINNAGETKRITYAQLCAAVKATLGIKDIADEVTGGASSIIASNLTANRALVSSSNGKVAVSAVTATELGYLAGVTSSIQTQLGGKAASSHGTHVTYAADAPKVAGTAAAGTAANVSRGDHVHPAQTTVSGNAGSATKLATARTIDGVSFNGSAAITHYGTCSTAAATVEKAVACTGFTLVTGAVIRVKFTVTNTAANPTLNVNSTGAKAIKYRNAAITAGYLAANRVYEFVYDGTDWELVGDIDTNTNTDTKNTAGSTDSSSKLFLIGAASQAANPQTYSHDTIYAGTDGHVYSNGKQAVNLSDSQALTNKTYNGFTLAAACARAVATAATKDSTALITSGAVYTALAGKQATLSAVVKAVKFSSAGSESFGYVDLAAGQIFLNAILIEEFLSASNIRVTGVNRTTAAGNRYTVWVNTSTTATLDVVVAYAAV